MTEFETSTTEPPYISRLALQSAPFHIVNNIESYYSGTQSEHRLNLLRHLVRSTDKIGIIVAQEGLGKTTLLFQLQQRAGDELRICHVDGEAQLDTNETLVSCLRQLGLDKSEIEAGDDLANLLENRLKQLRRINIRPLLLLDNGQRLSEQSLMTLSHWLSWQDGDDYLLQAVIATNSDISLADSVQSRIQMVDLPVMQEQDISAYLMFRLTSVGYQGESPFSDKDVQQIYRLSAGNPALINQLAHQQLLGLKPTSLKSSSFDFSLLKVGIRWFGVASLIVLFALLLGYQDQLNQWLTPPSKNSEIVEQSVTDVLEDAELTMVVVEDDKVKTNEQAQREELTSLLSEIEQVEPQHDVEPLAVKESIIAEESSIADIHQQDWILQHQSSQYTFQLMGSWDKQEVMEFINKYSLEGDVAMFESMRNGRSWYAVIYGVFDSKQDALSASKDWPTPLNTLPSWLRRFDSVQKQIKSTVQVQ
ncbi:MAG: AAA family ATPase [Methylophagaceae bacterium]